VRLARYGANETTLQQVLSGIVIQETHQEMR